MNTQAATTRTSDSRETQATEQGGNFLQVGSRVCVISYGPFRGLRGTIRTVDTIPADLEEPFCFYLIALDGAYVKEPVWFEYDEVELVAPPSVALHANREHPGTELR